MSRLALPMRCIPIAGLTAVLVISCGSNAAPPEPETSTTPHEHETSRNELNILTSIDVYADLVSEVVGDTAEVSAMVSSTAVDPHSYEATPQDRLAVADADVLIANGGGYDPYITTLAEAAEKEDAVYQLIDGENWHSHEFDGTYENEHIWYDLARMSEFATDIAEYLGDLTPEHAQEYTENGAELSRAIDTLNARNQQLPGQGKKFLSTEAVSGFLLQDAGLEDVTELEFLAAVEHGDDVSPRLFQDALNKAADHEIDLLSYNQQTETQQSQRIREAAEASEVKVLEFSETIPENTAGYVEWMDQNISSIESALQP